MKRPFIWLSTQDWDDVWTRKQRFAQLFARRGHRVLYVEAPQIDRADHAIEVRLTRRKGQVLASSAYSEHDR